MPEMEVEVGTKRYASYGTGESNKKPRQGGIKLRLLIKGNYAGALIGKGGENFKRLREQYGVKITGLSTRAEDRVLQLEGDKGDCASIIKDLLPLCPDASFVAQANRSPVELNLLVNTSQVGLVIGKAGAKLKEIREESGGHIKVYPDCLPNSNERVVALGGEDEVMVLVALDMVLSTLDGNVPNTPTAYYDPANTQINPLAGSQIGQQQQAKGGHTNTNNRDAVSLDVAKLLIARLDMKQRNPLPAANDFGQVPTVTVLTVPNLMVGAIIGRSGMNIKQIRMSSGAEIDFSKNESGDQSADRVITITGTQDQIQIAEVLMAQFVGASKNVTQS